jgi:hypothetical protein
MRYEMKNFVKTTKKKRLDNTAKKDDWKRERKAARKTKQTLRRQVA